MVDFPLEQMTFPENIIVTWNVNWNNRVRASGHVKIGILHMSRPGRTIKSHRKYRRNDVHTIGLAAHSSAILSSVSRRPAESLRTSSVASVKVFNGESITNVLHWKSAQ